MSTSLNQLLSQFPEESHSYIKDIFNHNHFQFKITRSRSSKLGDFSYKNRQYKITVNGDLNPYAFLTTFLHELAHLKVYELHQNKVDPHGLEWKCHFAEILRDIVKSCQLPSDIKHAYLYHAEIPRASSGADKRLLRTLRKYDLDENVLTVDLVPMEETFQLGNKVFRKLEKRRTRWLCVEVHTEKKYLVHGLTQVK